MFFRSFQLEVLIITCIMKECSVDWSTIGCSERFLSWFNRLYWSTTSQRWDVEWTETETTNQSMSPNFLHMHSFRMPDVSFQPYFLTCRPSYYVSISHRLNDMTRTNPRCRFSNTWVRLNLKYKVRFFPSIFLVNFFGLAESFGVCSHGLSVKVAEQIAGDESTSDIAFARNLDGNLLTLWLAALRRRWRGKDWNALTVHDCLFFTEWIQFRSFYFCFVAHLAAFIARCIAVISKARAWFKSQRQLNSRNKLIRGGIANSPEQTSLPQSLTVGRYYLYFLALVRIYQLWWSANVGDWPLAADPPVRGG